MVGWTVHCLPLFPIQFPPLDNKRDNLSHNGSDEIMQVKALVSSFPIRAFHAMIFIFWRVFGDAIPFPMVDVGQISWVWGVCLMDLNRTITSSFLISTRNIDTTGGIWQMKPTINGSCICLSNPKSNAYMEQLAMISWLNNSRLPPKYPIDPLEILWGIRRIYCLRSLLLAPNHVWLNVHHLCKIYYLTSTTLFRCFFIFFKFLVTANGGWIAEYKLDRCGADAGISKERNSFVCTRESHLHAYQRNFESNGECLVAWLWMNPSTLHHQLGDIEARNLSWLMRHLH